MNRRLAVVVLFLLLAVAFAAGGCNLVAESALTPTIGPTSSTSATPGTVTPTSTLFIPTLSGQVPTGTFPTAVIPPTVALPPTAQPVPIRVVIISPTPGSFVAGTISVFGSAIAPNFLQYQLEYGPEPNAGNLWYPADSVKFAPVQDGLLGQWNTSPLPDGAYTLRLRVFLRDGSVLTSSVAGLQVRNARPTPQPTATSAIPRPTAAFSQSATAGDVPLTVRFFNQSSGIISAFLWNFGDGTTSTEINPTKTYVTPGLYNVTLTVNGPGGSSNVTSQVNVRGPQAPRAAFIANPTNGDAPLTVQFTDTSSGVISSWFWNFGNGQTSTERNPRVTFNNVGTFNVFLTVTGPGGTSVAFVPVMVRSPQIPPPVASFTFSPSAGQAPLSVQFNNTSSGNITSFSWNFGDGTTSNATSPVKVYQFAGTYTVTLIAFGPGGQAAATGTVTVSAAPTATPTVTLTPLPPTATPTATATATATLTPSATTTVVPPTATPTATATFTETATVIPLSTVTATPTPTATQTPTDTTTAVPPTATFTETPTSTSVPPTATFTETPTTTAVPPTATLTETPTNTPIPPPVANFTAVVLPDNSLSVQFTNLSTGEGLSSFSWDFGDGTASFETNPIHVYAAGGTYAVTLTATGAGGNNSISQVVTVAAPTATTVPVQSSFTFSIDPANPLSVQFTNMSTGPVAGFQWTFGDGVGTSTDANPLYTYAVGGSYIVSLTVTSVDGTTSSAQQTVTVVVPTATTEPVVAGFTFTVDPVNPLTVQFSNASTGPIVSSFWNLGDGTVSNEPNPLHTYAFGGSFQVALTVTSTDGTMNSIEQTVNVVAPTATTEPVLAAFSAVVDPTNPLAVQFTSTSSGPIAGYLWNFGDGMVSNEQNPTHAYAFGGSFEVSLTVTGTDGSTNGTQQTVNVVAPTATTEPVQAGFTFTPDPVNPLAVQFTSSSTGPIASYFWNLGDGQVSNEQNPLHTYAFGGDFVVALTVTSTDGTTSSTEQTVTVSAPPTATTEPVAADFTFVTAPDNPLLVQFTSLSTGPVATFNWTFGDGVGTSTEQNPVYTYAAGGTYDVTLTVTAADGVTTNSVTLPVELVVASPFLSPEAPSPVFTLQNGSSGVYTIAYNPSFNLLAAGNEDGTVTIWDVASQTVFQTLANHVEAVTAVSWSPDGSRLASSSLDETVVITETASWTPVASLSVSNDASVVAYSPNGTMLATGSLDGAVQFWDAAGNLLNTIPTADEVYWLAWRPDGTQIAYTGREGNAVVLDVATGTPVVTIPLNGDSGTSVAWNSSGSQLVVGTSSGAAVYDSASGGLFFAINDASGSTVLSAAWSPAGDRIALGTSDLGLLVVDAFSGNLITALPASGDVTGVAWNAFNGQLAASIDNGNVEVWQP